MPPNPLTTWLTDLGLWGKLARDKFFPARVWTWSQRYLAEFLRVLMSCDGSIYASEMPVIHVSSSASLHASLPPMCTTRSSASALSRSSIATTHGAWRVQMTAPEAVRRYQEEIGWIGEKATRFAGLERALPKRVSNIGHPPQETWALVRSAAQAQDLSMSGAGAA